MAATIIAVPLREEPRDLCPRAAEVAKLLEVPKTYYGFAASARRRIAMRLLSEQFERALLYAHELHGDQYRKGTPVPYMAHLMGVASLVLEYGGDEEQVIAALLHDAIEDCGERTSYEAIHQRFGERVTEIVRACTDTDATPKPPWRARKEAYVARVTHESADARLVSAADKLYNVRTVLKDYRLTGPAVWQRFTGDPADVLWYYRALVDAFRQAGSHPVVDELDRAVTQLEAVVTPSRR
jgi:(p)ppGpp synthase/HD superfamily hydrolase